MSNKKQKRARGAVSVKEILALHYEGVQDEIEKIIDAELDTLREEFVTKANLREMLADVERKLCDHVNERLRREYQHLGD